jgi:nucleotide-binding universal stress UspA family protein
MMKILLAADGSDYTIKAVEYLVQNFEIFKEQPELHVLHVQPPIPENRARAVLGSDAVQNYYEVESNAALAPAETFLKGKGVTFKRAYTVGDVAEQMQAYVNERGIDMIVMGSHGRSGFKSLVLGSVATKILAMSTVPVLVVR